MTIRPHLMVALLSSLFLALSASSEEEKTLTEVVLLPTIHGKHKTSQFYHLERLSSVMRAIKPDIVCSEITPASLKTFDSGKPHRRLSLFPEYTGAILPLRKELGYEVVSCSAWSQKVNFQTVGVKKMDEAHYGLIAKALDRYEGQGKKVLITFGGGHINGLLAQLRERKDIKIVDYRPTLEKLLKEEAQAKS